MAGEQHPRLGFPDVAKLELDELIDQLVERAHDVKRAQGRLRALLHAIETITGDLTLDAVLHNVVAAACELAGARYGAFAVQAVDDDAVDRVIEVGDMPRGQPEPGPFLDVPIHSRGEVVGNLHLAGSARREFSAEDEQLLAALAATAGVAISNARTYQHAQRLYEESRLRQRWLEATVEIDTQMLASSGEDPLELIARRAIEIAEADLVTVNLLSSDGEQLAVEVAYGTSAEDLLGRRFSVAESIGGEVVRHGVPVLHDDITARGGPPTPFASVLDPGPIMVLPLAGTAGRRGVLTLLRTHGRPAFSTTDLAMANSFAGHASVALELADARVAEQRLTLLEDRDRIAKDLHDHVIQELFAIGLSLEGAAAQLDPNTKIGQRIHRRAEDIDRTIRRIRTSIFQLRGNFVDTEGGLRQRVLEVAADLTPALGFTPHVAFAGVVDVNLDPELSDDVLACVREALTNVARHARATSASVDLVMKDDEITVTVIDNGVGPEGASRRSGTANLQARAEKRSGSFELTTAPGGGTVVTWKARIT